MSNTNNTNNANNISNVSGVGNARWTRDEEMSLIKDIASGLQIELLSQKHNRSNSAIELRLKKIIYENVKSGKSLQNISHLLKLPSDKTAQYYYAYKEFKEKHTGVADNEINVTNNAINVANTVKTFVPQVQTQQGGDNSNVNNINIEKAFQEPNNLEKIESKLRRLEMENRILKLVVENKELTQQLNKLIKEGKVDPSIKTLIKVFRKSV